MNADPYMWQRSGHYDRAASVVSPVVAKSCPYCGSPPHEGTCPRVEAIEYFPDGHIRRVELKE